MCEIERFAHIHFDKPIDIQENALMTATRSFSAQLADLTNNTIYNAIIETARNAGITDLYLLDKSFVLSALRAQQERENPKPLTLDELRERDGEPVYLTGRQYQNGWAIIHDIDGDAWPLQILIPGFYPQDVDWNGYGKTWLAYDHPPKEDKL